jgi:hypothetical protein
MVVAVESLSKQKEEMGRSVDEIRFDAASEVLLVGGRNRTDSRFIGSVDDLPKWFSTVR